MSARYSQSSGFNPRDRSPQRFGDRRPPAGPRGSEDAGLPIGREPPRAPKALIDTPRGGSFGGRGRGYPARGDFRDRGDRDPRERDRAERDRDFRDSRDGPPPFRRDIDRDWGRRNHDFDTRESRVGFGRGRSRSPPPPRDFRDTREPIGRDPDAIRMRRGSRDSLLSVSSAVPDGPPLGAGPHSRPGLIRGRGRGDWDGGRGRGRMPYLDDRDSFRRRSRSRDGRWERERDRPIDRDRDRERLGVDRERDRDIERRENHRDDRRDRFDRRDEHDRRMDRDDRDRPGDIRKRDRPPSRNETRNSSITSGPPIPPSVHAGPASSDRVADVATVEHPRKSSGGDSWRDFERLETLSSRPDPSKDFIPPVVKRSPPPVVPQVPAFGSVTAPIPDISTEKTSTDAPPIPSSLPKAEKDRQEPGLKPQMQPPTGPKADRGPSHHGPEQRSRRDEVKREEIGETITKQESPVRTFKTPQTVSVGLHKPTELSPPTAPAAMVAKENAVTPESSPVKLGSATNFLDTARGPPLAGQSTSPVSHTSPRMHSSSIPTGPRALQQRPPPSRGPSKGNKLWVRPGFNRPHTGTSPPLPPKRDSIDGRDRSLSISEDVNREVKMLPDEQLKSPEVSRAEINSGIVTSKDKGHAPLQEFIAPLQNNVSSPSRRVVEERPAKIDGDKDVMIPDFERSSDEDDDENVFSQEFLEKRKQDFEKDMKALRAEMPPSPLEDPNIVSLLKRIQLLGMIANELQSEKPWTPSPAVDEAVSVEELPDPSQEKEVDKKIEEQELPTNVVLRSLPDAVSVESLPFLHSGPPTPMSDLDVCQDNLATHERIKTILRGELIDQRKAIAKKNAELRLDWLAYYKRWRLSVWELDRAKEKTTVTPGLTPPPPPPPVVTPTPVLETREGRRYKGNSELDFQNALRASEISAQEELARRRENKATAQPDLTREAVIPDMLEPREVKATIYKDTNNIVETSQAMDVFGFLPPPNDFTPEEHEAFTDAFMAYPKKWGKIADSLPGRDFKQCIVHYYLTKEEIKYKAKLNKRWSRRGRARRSARPKSNALMADLGVVKPDYDGEEEPTPVTDTGRPRRAAAPTFGDSSADTEQSANGRRGNAGKDGEQGEKPAGRRGARSGTGSRGGRRGKAAQQQQQQQQQQQPPPPQPSSLTPQPEQPATTVAVVPAVMTPIASVAPVSEPVLPNISLEPVIDPRVAVLKDQTERDMLDGSSRAKPGRGRQREGLYAFDSTEVESATASPVPGALRQDLYNSPQTTSYWSVPEQRDFPQLLAHFGRDFESISNFMKTKSTQMVKNYFQRRLDSGKRDYEEIAADAEMKKAQGESTGALPIPNFTSKRRYEATPSTVSMSRPLAPHTEATPELDDARLVSQLKHPTLSSQPGPMHSRPLHERERSIPGMSRYPPLAQASTTPMAPHSPALALAEEPPRTIHTHTGLPQRMQGPRMGYFAEDKRDSAYPHATPRSHEHSLSSRAVAVSASEMMRMEPMHGQGFRTSGVDVHGSPVLPGQSAGVPSHQPYMQSLAQPHTQPPQSLMPPGSHSRQHSLTKPPGSPVQGVGRHESEMSHIRRDSIGQRSFYPLHNASGMQQPAPVLSPTRDPIRSGLLPVEPPEPPRQVPAKRSNIMSILNDEPEEPQPRKRFASDQTSSAAAAGASSPSRPVYTGSSSLPQPAPSRQEEAIFSASQLKGPGYSHQSPYLPPSRNYPDYGSYGPASGAPGPAGNTDWLGRFDPRGQPQSQQLSSAPPPPSSTRSSTTMASQPTYSPFASSQNALNQALPHLNAPSPAPTPSPAPPPPRSSYPASVYAPSPAAHAQSAGGGPRDLPSQTPLYRSAMNSPTMRSSHGAYPSRSGLSAASSYGSTGPATSVSVHVSGTPQPHPGGPQGYPHLQAMASAAHQTQSHRAALGLSGAQYGRNTPPPPQPQTSRMAPLPGPSSQQIGRSYTPPAILQPTPTGGMAYAPGGPVNPHTLQTRPSGPLSDAVPGPHGGSGHHRVYSQGSGGPFPGPLPSQHPPR
ncbi:hypothetical protein BJX64DRAFT_209400 [Aspergillus heterothallicus]